MADINGEAVAERAAGKERISEQLVDFLVGKHLAEDQVKPVRGLVSPDFIRLQHGLELLVSVTAPDKSEQLFSKVASWPKPVNPQKQSVGSGVRLAKKLLDAKVNRWQP